VGISYSTWLSSTTCMELAAASFFEADPFV
jgi:hypothetical protein